MSRVVIFIFTAVSTVYPVLSKSISSEAGKQQAGKYKNSPAIGKSRSHVRKISFSWNNLKHIQFNKISPTNYKISKHGLVARVNKSASALIYAFPKPVTINQIRFEWMSNGKLGLKPGRDELTKKGDDSYFRIGLMIYGKARSIPFFAPAWIKLTNAHMRAPASKLLYLFVGASRPAGSKWVSPYSSSIRVVSIASRKTASGYQHATKKFDKPLKIVGLWLMADGDNTGSSFTTSVRNIYIYRPAR